QSEAGCRDLAIPRNAAGLPVAWFQLAARRGGPRAPHEVTQRARYGLADISAVARLRGQQRAEELEGPGLYPCLRFGSVPGEVLRPGPVSRGSRTGRLDCARVDLRERPRVASKCSARP